MRLTLETERLILRPFTLGDAEAMYANWASDDEVTKYLTWPTHQSLETTRMILAKWVEEYEQPERLNFAIERKEDGRLIGGIDVVHYVDGVPVIGYASSRAVWNRGYMTEACRRVLDYLFSQGFEAVKIDAIVENVGSNRVIQKCGGELIGTETEHLTYKDRDVTVNRYLVRA